MKKNCLAVALILLTVWSLAACTGTGSDDRNEPWREWDTFTAADFDEDSTDWQGDDGSQLRITVSSGTYLLRTWYGRTGLGVLAEGDGGLEMFSQDPDGNDICCYLVRDGGGFTVRQIGGLEGREHGELNGVHFEPAQEEIVPYDSTLLDGVWQNALGYTLAFDTDKMRFIRCEGSIMGSTALYDRWKGAGIFMGGEELLIPIVSADGNALVLFGMDNSPRVTGVHSTGVFYRDGNVEAYADPENACFEERDGRLWYYDGVRSVLLPSGYTLGEDGAAYDAAGEPFAPQWPAPEDRFDVAAEWGEGWEVVNMGSNK